RRFAEQAIPLHTPVYVMGQSRERRDLVAPEIAEDKQAPIFMISTRSEEQISRGYGTAFWGWGIFGLLLSVGAVFALDMGKSPPAYFLAALGYLTLWIVGWIWMAYNS